jgi:dihydrofolate reductase
MRRVVLMIGISLDGYIEGPGGDISWHRVDEEVHEHFNEVLGPMGAFLEGRVTYEMMEEFWPTADQGPDVEPSMAEFARIWRGMPKVVYSRTLERVGPNATIVRDVVAEEVMALKAQPGGDLVVGGPHLAAEFLRQDLVDEFHITVHPVLIGEGTPLFLRPDVRMSLRLLETRTFGNGVVLLRYERAGQTEQP